MRDSRPDHATQRRAAAFFDLDKTVVAKSSTLAFRRELYREGLISPSAVIRGTYAQLVYQLLGANADRMERSRSALLALTKGWDAAQVQRLIRETLQDVLDPLIYAEALELFEEHRQAGRELYLVSSAGEEVVIPLAEYLDVPHVLATRPGIDAEGRYDGTLDFYCYGENKAAAMRAAAAEHGLDLDASYAYTDSITDLPMLETVGYPVAVNPDKELRAVALQRGFEVRDFHRPVTLRQRLPHVPRPPAEVMAGAGALGAAAVAGWVLLRRQHEAPPPEQRGLERLVSATRAGLRR